MAKTKAITYIFRRPRFPLICEIDGYLFGVRSPAGLERGLARIDASRHRDLKLIDANAARWMFLPDERVVAPAFAVRPVRKIEIIRLFNESRAAKAAGLCYPERALKNRRFDVIVDDLVELLSRAK